MTVFTEKCLRLTCYVLQFVCFVTGIAMLGLGVWGLVDPNLHSLTKSDHTILSGLYVLVIAGSMILFVTILGCVAIKRERKLFVILYCILGLVAIFLKIVGCILVFDYFVSKHEYLQRSYELHYGTEHYENVTTIWDEIQETCAMCMPLLSIALAQGGCCGLINYRDWEKSRFYLNGNRRMFPKSCCKPSGDPDACQRGKDGHIVTEGCDEFIKKYYYGIGGAAVVIILIELFAVVMLACLYQYYP